MLKKNHIYLLLFAVLLSCSKKDEIVPVKSAEKSITLFTLNSFSPAVKANIDSVRYTITASVPIGTDITKLSPTITISKLASISPSSGTIQDFTSPVVYTVTAENGTVQTYTVKINIAKSSSKSITSFSFSSLPKVIVLIDSIKKAITATLPEGTDLTKLVPTIIASNKATIIPASGQAQDFTNPVTYNVSAEDGTTQSYIVTLKVNFSYKNSIYFVHNGTLFARNLTTGKVNWTFDVGTNSSAPTVKDGIVYVGIYSNICAIDGNTGVKIWEFKVKGGLRNDPTVAGEIVYFCDVFGAVFGATDKGNIYAVDIKTGLLKWSVETTPRIATTNPTIVNGILYITATDYTSFSNVNTLIYAFDALTGQKKWEYSFNSECYGRPNVVNETLYLGVTGGKVYAINIANGKLKWVSENSYGITSSLSVFDGILYANDSFNDRYPNLRAFDTTTGIIKWSNLTIGSRGLFISNRMVYVITEKKKVLAMDAKTGSKMWMFSTDFSSIISGLIVANNILYCIGSDNSSNSKSRFYAVDASNGALFYSFSMDSIFSNYLSDICIVDSNGKVYHSTESGEQQ